MRSYRFTFMMMSLLICIFGLANLNTAQAATTEQRVNTILKQKPELKSLADAMNGKMLIYVYKYGRTLEVHNKGWDKPLVYPMTEVSGYIGPKLMEGDEQIPEGIYEIKRLNPNSRYHLSLQVSYPNKFDKMHAKSDKRYRLGGDIMIHGKDVTIGCVPIGDDAIENVFYLASVIGIENINVIIAPYDMRLGRRPELEDVDIAWYPELLGEIENAVREAFPESLLNKKSITKPEIDTLRSSRPLQSRPMENVR